MRSPVNKTALGFPSISTSLFARIRNASLPITSTRRPLVPVLMTSSARTSLALLASTLTATDLDAVAEAYERWLGYRVAVRTPVSAALAQVWQTPHAQGRAMMLLQPASGARAKSVAAFEASVRACAVISPAAAGVTEKSFAKFAEVKFPLEIEVEGKPPAQLAILLFTLIRKSLLKRPPVFTPMVVALMPKIIFGTHSGVQVRLSAIAPMAVLNGASLFRSASQAALLLEAMLLNCYS